MRSEGLTAKQVEHIQAGPKRIEVPAGGGLFLVVHPTGRKTWMYRYRFRGRTRGMTLPKAYPELTLKQARAEAAASQAILRTGCDPSDVQAVEKEQQERNSVIAICSEWLEREASNTRTFPEVKRIVHREIVAPWKHKLVTEIGRADVLRLFDSIVDRPAPVLANRVRSILLRIFGYCLERGYVEASPIANIKPPGGREKTRERVLDSSELLLVWKAAASFPFPFGPYVQLLILTGQRRREVAGMRWSDIDLEKGVWKLPAHLAKPGREHLVPLSPEAVKILESLPKFSGPNIFSTTSGARPISGFSKMRRALDAKISELCVGTEMKIGEWHLHDLRRTLASWMAANKIPPVVLSALLNHSPGKLMGITSVYARYDYLQERIEALNLWAAHVESLAKKTRDVGRKLKSA